MKKYLTCLLLLYGFFVKAGNIVNEIKVNVHLKPSNTIRLRYLDNYLVQNVLEFRNVSVHDTVISRELKSDKIIEFTYSLKDLGNNKAYFYLFYAKGGDVINIKVEDYQLKNLGNNQYLFVNNFLDVDDSIFRGEEKNSVKDLLGNDRKVLNRNLKITDSLRASGKIDDFTASLWTEISNSYYIKKIARLPYTDSLTNVFVNYLDHKSQLNSSAIVSAVYAQLYYSSVKENINRTIDKSIQEIIKLNIDKKIKCGVAFSLLLDFSDKNSSFYLTAYRLFENELLDSAFKEQVYFKRISKQKAFDKSSITMVRPDNSAITLSELFKKNKNKVMVFDFWATWCIPCISEIPVLETIKKRLSNKDIVFVSIGLDKDNKATQWKSLSKKLNITGQQYRVQEKSNKAISTYYGIVSIPRYLIIDKNGILINDNFLKPSDRNFEERLLKYVN